MLRLVEPTQVLVALLKIRRKIQAQKISTQEMSKDFQ